MSEKSSDLAQINVCANHEHIHTYSAIVADDGHNETPEWKNTMIQRFNGDRGTQDLLLVQDVDYDITSLLFSHRTPCVVNCRAKNYTLNYFVLLARLILTWYQFPIPYFVCK